MPREKNVFKINSKISAKNEGTQFDNRLKVFVSCQRGFAIISLTFLPFNSFVSAL